MEYYSGGDHIKRVKYILDPVIEYMIDLAEGDDNIRAVLLEGSYTLEKQDKKSDRDIVFVTRTNQPYFDGKIIPQLVKHFGEIAVMQTPDNGDPHDVYTHLIQFLSGKEDLSGHAVRIDLTFNSIEFLSRTPLESATVVLLDKNDRFSDVPEPSDRDFWVKKPSQQEFDECSNEFWWTVPYVWKALQRGQRIHALELMNECVRPQFVKMMSWLAGARNEFRVSVGKHASEVGRYVPEYSKALLLSYSDSFGIGNALAELVVAFPKLAGGTASALNYTYNAGEGERVVHLLETGFDNSEPRRFVPFYSAENDE